MSAIILGDIHLNKSINIGKTGIGSNLNSRLADQFSLLEWTLDQAIKRKINNIITTGDIFEDPRPSPTVISLFIGWLKKCADNDVSIHLIRGNHDTIRSGQHIMSAFDIISSSDMEDIFVYNDIATLEMPGISFTMLPFRDRRSFNTNINLEALSILQKKIKYERCIIDNRNIKIAIGHFAIEGSLPVGDEIADMCNELFIPVDTMKDYDFSFFGHIHKPQVMSKYPYVSHIGSMDLSNFSENTHNKVIAIIDPDKSDVMELVELPCRPLKQISISVPADI